MSTNATFDRLGQEAKKIDYEMNGDKLGSVQCIKDLGVAIASNLKFSRQCKDAAGKATQSIR